MGEEKIPESIDVTKNDPNEVLEEPKKKEKKEEEQVPPQSEQ